MGVQHLRHLLVTGGVAVPVRVPDYPVEQARLLEREWLHGVPCVRGKRGSGSALPLNHLLNIVSADGLRLIRARHQIIELGKRRKRHMFFLRRNHRRIPLVV